MSSGPSRDTEYVGCDIAQRDVRRFQNFLDAVGLLAVDVDQLTTSAGEFAQLPERRGGHEAAAQQAVLQQFGNPLTIFDVGLPPWHFLDVRGVDLQDGQLPLLKDLIDGAPVNPPCSPWPRACSRRP
jgi:hypothetical protein